MSVLPTYVVITPARNEAQFIELTIQSLVAQSVRPSRWIIVSDGSTDDTDDIVRKYSASHSWIELLRMPERQERHFAGKVQAFNAGYARVRDLPFDAIASLDADISFDPEYFSFLLSKLAEDPHLGLVGTPFKEGPDQVYDYRFVNIEHVSGACQLFRRDCFEQIGGYVPVKGGGIDYIAVIGARMRGWRTRTFPEKVCHHHREMGTAQHSGLGTRSQGWRERLCARQPSAVAARPHAVSNDQATSGGRWFGYLFRLYGGLAQPNRKVGLKRNAGLYPARTDAAPKGILHRQSKGRSLNLGSLFRYGLGGLSARTARIIRHSSELDHGQVDDRLGMRIFTKSQRFRGF